MEKEDGILRWEVLDIATRIASSLFIEKNKQYRADRIKSRE